MLDRLLTGMIFKLHMQIYLFYTNLPYWLRAWECGLVSTGGQFLHANLLLYAYYIFAIYYFQGTEISSTSNSQSPPIALTRASDFQYNPDIPQSLLKYQHLPSIPRIGTSILQPLKRHIDSDRVLRSFNSVRRPNYRYKTQFR